MLFFFSTIQVEKPYRNNRLFSLKPVDDTGYDNKRYVGGRKMKKNLAKKVTLSILAGAVLMSSSVVWAAEVNGAPPGTGWDVFKTDYYAPTDGRGVSAFDNNITISDDSSVCNFAGGYSDRSDVYNNKMTISGSGQFEGEIYGGYATANVGVYDNHITINNARDGYTFTFNESIYGGYSHGTDATGNTVTIEGGNFDAPIYGGYSYSGNAGGINDSDGNTVNITGGSFERNIYGGCSSSGDAIGNTVNITKGSFEGDVYGGYSGSGNNGDGNTVTINGGTFITPDNLGTLLVGGYLYIGDGNANANNNKLIITDFDTAQAEIAGETSVDKYEGFEFIAGGMAPGEANENEVEISGGKVAIIYGKGSIVGGSGKTSAQGNKITISGCANIEEAGLIGGKVSDANGIVAGNILNIGTESTPWQATDTGKANGIKVQNKTKFIKGFDTINFNNIAWEKGGTVVEATDLTLNNTKITANIKSGTLTEAKEMMNLIKTENDIVGKIADEGNTVNVGIAESYEGAITQTDNAIVITLTGTPPEDKPTENPEDKPTEDSEDKPTENPENKPTEDPENKPTEDPENKPTASRNDQVLVLGESRAAAVAFTNQGSELIETGLNALARDNEKDTKVFAAVYGNHSEYETGSHVNVNGWSGIVGIGKTNADGLTVGAFFENGEGNYSTHNIFTNDYIRGDGEACYNGGGFLIRKDNANGVYTEASLRAGNLQNELRNAVRNGSELTGYDIDTFYYGAYVGIGKVIARGNDGDSIDVYGKFIYTHHDGETFDIGGTATKFDSVESERLRLGFRINEVQTNKLSMYYGAAWEYEFNGDAHDKIASFDLETPSLEGSTVIGEFGAHYKASDKWSIDLNGRAYVGQREGFSGSVQANYAF